MTLVDKRFCSSVIPNVGPKRCALSNCFQSGEQYMSEFQVAEVKHISGTGGLKNADKNRYGCKGTDNLSLTGK